MAVGGSGAARATTESPIISHQMLGEELFHQSELKDFLVNQKRQILSNPKRQILNNPKRQILRGYPNTEYLKHLKMKDDILPPLLG